VDELCCDPVVDVEKEEDEEPLVVDGFGACPVVEVVPDTDPVVDVVPPELDPADPEEETPADEESQVEQSTLIVPRISPFGYAWL